MKDAAEIIEGVNDVVRCLTGDRPFGRIICACYGGRDSSGSEKYCVARHLFTREYRRLEVMLPLVGRNKYPVTNMLCLAEVRGTHESRLEL